MHKFAYLAPVFIVMIFISSCVDSTDVKSSASQAEKTVNLTDLMVDEYHGYTHVDSLQHLEVKDEDGKPSKDTQLIIDEYNAVSSRFFEHHDTELSKIYAEIMSRRPDVSDTMPFKSRGLVFSLERQEGESFPVMYYAEPGSDEKNVLIDQSIRAEGNVDYAFQNYELSPDNQYFSWIEDTESGSVTTLYITPTGKPNDLIHKISGVGLSLAWDDQSKRVYYIKVDPDDGRYHQIRMYNLETQTDVEIYTENDDKFMSFVYGSDGSNGIFIYTTNWSISESLYINFDKSYIDHTLVLGRDKAMTFGMGKFDNTYVVSYQADKETSKIASFVIPDAERESWETLYMSKASMTEYTLTKNYFVFVERSEGADQIKMLNVADKKFSNIDISQDRYGAYFMSGKHDPNNDIIRIAYTTFLSNRATVDVDLANNEIKNDDKPSIPGLNPADYVVEIKYTTSHDNVNVPLTIIRHKDTQLPAPTYQYVYGSYGYGMSPGVPSAAMSLIDRGFVYVISHVRGGNELGKQWHEGGRLLNRKNSFADFAAISQYLIDDGYTTVGNISIGGESAAGHILGVAVNDNPQLYKSLTALVPAFDIFNKLLNPDLLVTKTSWSEFGNPIESKKAYEYILSYSALENIKAQDYPPYFITARLNDRNVGFFEPLKWAVTIDKNDTNLEMNMMSIEDGSHVRTGFGGVEYDFARQMLFVLETHGK